MKKKMMLTTALTSVIALMFAIPASAADGRTVVVDYAFPSVGQGDLGGVCFLQSETSVIPPELWSCLEADPEPGETHVDVTVTDNSGNPVYISIQQDNNPNFAVGCGTITDFPILSSGPGGSPADPVVVFPWAGPGINDFFENLDPDDLCAGSTSVEGGTGTFVFNTL